MKAVTVSHQRPSHVTLSNMLTHIEASTVQSALVYQKTHIKTALFGCKACHCARIPANKEPFSHKIICRHASYTYMLQKVSTLKYTEEFKSKSKYF